MSINEELKHLLLEHDNLKKKYQNIIKKVDETDYINENEELRKQLANCRRELRMMEIKLDKLKEENTNLRTNLNEQIIDEKLGILKISQDKLNVYFRKTQVGSVNRLKALERTINGKIKNLEITAKNEFESEFMEFEQKFSKLKREVNESLDLKKKKLENESLEEKTYMDNEYKKLKDEGISEDVIKKRIRDNNLEIKIGLKIVSVIGVILILIGLSTALKYAYSMFFTPTYRGLTVYLIGVIFLISGEMFYRRKKEIFSYSMVGGGIAILYIATFNSYFNLKIMNMNIAMIISIFITLIALLLALRFDSKVIISISLFGGYLPFFTYVFSFGLNGDKNFLIAGGYLLILNCLVIMISAKKRWISVNYISFILNMPSMLYILFSFKNEIYGIGLAFIIFILYLTTIMVNPLKFKKPLIIPDILLLAINTMISCIVTFALLYKGGYERFDGLLALSFCVIYTLLALLAKYFIKSEKSSMILFMLTSYAFAILMIPLQFGIKWFSLGWMIESILLILFGYRKKIKFAEFGGWFIFGLCYMSVIFIDFFISSMTIRVSYLHLRYLLLITGMIIVLVPYIIDIYKDRSMEYLIKGKIINVYKYFTILNIWIFSLVEIIDKLKFLNNSYRSFFEAITFGLATLTIAYLIIYIPQIKDKVTKAMSIFMICISNLIIIVNTYNYQITSVFKGPKAYLLITMLIVLNIYAFMSIRLLMIGFLKKAKINLEYYTVIMCIYLLFIVNKILSYQFGLGDINLIFSILYIVAAFIMIIYGFSRKYIVSRRFGLMLSIFATGKLFIYDLSFLNMLGKIVSYLSFGVVLLCISYMYQKFSKQFEKN